MGFNIKTSELLIYSKKLGINFEDTLTIGRQQLHGSILLFERLFEKYNLDKRHLEEIQSNDRYFEVFLHLLGAKVTDSLDANEYENATIIHDMNLPIPCRYKGSYSVVIDGGSLEHVFNFPVAIRNCMEMVKVGGHFIGAVPTNNFLGHGFYQFSPELFWRVFCKENGFRVIKMILYFDDDKSPLYEVSDPLLVKNRVKLKNCRESLLFVVANKFEERPLFLKPIQQSDYQFVSLVGEPAKEKSGQKQCITALVKKFIPRKALIGLLRIRLWMLHLKSLIGPIGNGQRQYFKRIKVE